MAFHYVTTCFVPVTRTEYSFLSKQSVLSVRMRPRFLSLNRLPELVWDSQRYEAGATAAMRTKVSRTSQGCHICNQTDRHPEVTHPVRFIPMPLMKRKFFRGGQVNKPNTIHFAVDTALWPSEKRRTLL